MTDQRAESTAVVPMIDFTTRCLLILFFYGLIIIVSLLGNGLVCYAVLVKGVAARNSTNYLIANLALSDILMTIFAINFTIVDIILKNWIFGESLCHLLPFIQAMCVYVSSFTMLAIAINRYYLVYYNHHHYQPSSSKTLTSAKHIRTTRANFPDAIASSSTSNGLQIIPNSDGNTNTGRQQSLISLTPMASGNSWQVRVVVHRLLGCLLRPTKLSLTILVIWLSAMLHSLPFLWNNQLVEMTRENTTHVRKCIFLAKPPFTELTLTLFVFLTQYLMPLGMLPPTL